VELARENQSRWTIHTHTQDIIKMTLSNSSNYLVVSAKELWGQTSCDEYKDAFCPSFGDCHTVCGECLPALQDWFDCSVGGDSCAVDCGDLEVIPQTGNFETQCNQEEVTYQTCVAQELSGILAQNACFDCVNAGLSSTTASCDAFAAEFCPQFRQCDAECASCLPVLNEWYNCAIGGVSCKIDCLEGA